MSTSSSTSSPSSSAVTIPIPGKSILKKPPPPQTSLFSRITRFLPQPQGGGSTFGIRSSGSASGPSGSAGPGNGGHEGVADDGGPLKRAHFILPQIATVYPISSLNPPSTPNLKEEKRAIEEREAERRRRVVRGNNASIGSDIDENEEWWSMDKVDSFYRECCDECDEPPDPAISAAFNSAANTNPRTVDFSGVQLTFTSASILADVFAIEWGLRKIVFRECDLDEHTIKPILHSLLIPNSLTFLSVASNRRLKAPAFRLIGAYLVKATSLQFLDLSNIPLDKKSAEYVVASLTQPPAPGLASLRLDDCSLKPSALDVLAKAVRTSSLRNISLRHNKINATGAIALSVMIRDYPDSIPATNPGSSPSLPSSPFSSSHTLTTASLLLSPTASSPGQASSAVTGSGTVTPNSSSTPSPASSVTSLPLTSSLSNHTGPPTHPPLSPQVPPFAGPILPPPTHPSLQPMQTTYTPYVPRSKRGKPASSVGTAGSPTLGNVPIITTSVRGGVTAVTANGVSAGVEKVVDAVKGNGRSAPQRAGTYSHGPSAALLDKVRALDNLPRLGSLRTLDLKGNDLRSGTSYLAQVLKRNRTLKVLNLSENKLDVACLVAIADALKYNTCLETLDLSRNPCCGSGSSSGSGSLTRDRDRNLPRESSAARSDRSPSDLEGLQSLRMSLTLTTSLKRLFLGSTNLSTQGAIALAEFLPESRSLLHLDLTGNQDLGVAGVMALNEGLKKNRIMRCLDLEVPPGAEEFTRLCREILNTCIRNTEEAEKASQREQLADQTGGRTKAALWGMIEESELAKTVRLAGDKVGVIDTDIVLRARGCIQQLTSYIKNPSQPLHSPSYQIPSSPLSPQISGYFSPTSSFAPFPLPSGAQTQSHADGTRMTPEELISKGQKVTNELASVIAQVMNGENEVDPERLEELLNINDELTRLVAKAENAVRSPSTLQEQKADAGVGTENQSRRPNLTLEGLERISRGNAEGQSGVKESVVNGSEPSSIKIGEAQSPATPRVDKGKQKAAPEPIEHEKVLSPTASFLVSETNTDSEDEGVILDSRFPPFRIADEGFAPDDERIISPSSNDRSRSWVEEEGEVFRKGTVLLGPEEMEGEYDGEELRRELLEAMVERPAPRTLSVDEFGVETTSEAPQEDTVDTIPETPKPAPRPYISRSRSSSSSIMSFVSPTAEKAAALPLPASPRVDSPVPAALRSPTPSSSLPGTPTSEINNPFRPYALRTRTSNSSLNAK
ncbi:RNI-like protein [Marasmius fiardii PR-910]|nr:RNI-like protein [Marasmius fiardii PR-910]